MRRITSTTTRSNDKPEEGKVYALTGGPDTPSIANGNSWAESEVPDDSDVEDFVRKSVEIMKGSDSK